MTSRFARNKNSFSAKFPAPIHFALNGHNVITVLVGLAAGAWVTVLWKESSFAMITRFRSTRLTCTITASILHVAWRKGAMALGGWWALLGQEFSHLRRLSWWLDPFLRALGFTVVRGLLFRGLSMLIVRIWLTRWRGWSSGVGSAAGNFVVMAGAETFDVFVRVGWVVAVVVVAIIIITIITIITTIIRFTPFGKGAWLSISVFSSSLEKKFRRVPSWSAVQQRALNPMGRGSSGKRGIWHWVMVAWHSRNWWWGGESEGHCKSDGRRLHIVWAEKGLGRPSRSVVESERGLRVRLMGKNLRMWGGRRQVLVEGILRLALKGVGFIDIFWGIESKVTWGDLERMW